MNKKIMMILVAFSLNATPLIKTVAIVNNELITNVDISLTSKNFNLDKQDALNVLIKNKIILSVAKQHRISANDVEIEQHIKQLAKQNNLTYLEYINKNKDNLYALKNNIKDEIIKNKLFQAISENNKNNVSEEDIVRFYDLNQDKMGNAKFEQVKDNIRMYLLEENAKQAISTFIEKEEAKAQIKIF